jgi:hypothetical protein
MADLEHERLEICRALRRPHLLERLETGELQGLARTEQIIDLLVRELRHDGAAVHLVADQILPFEDPDRFAHRPTSNEAYNPSPFALTEANITREAA